MPVIGFSELLMYSESTLADREKAVGYLRLVHTSARDAARIVGRLREFYRAREQNDVFFAVDLQALVEQAILLTEPKWKAQAQGRGADIRIHSNVPVLPPITGEEQELREMLTNLIFNAVDAMPTGGTIRIAASMTTAKEVCLTLQDSGVGMTDEVRRRCFEPFFSTKGERGTGLGLAMVFGIVQRHNGRVEIESEPGRGTTFLIYLPVSEGGVAANGVGAIGSGDTRPRSILLVDDDELTREAVAALLREIGHDVTECASGLEGLKVFGTRRFDVVITDQAMPGLTGEQLASSIKQVEARQPVILLTGFHIEGTPSGGVDRVILKPTNLEMLRRTVDELCA